MDDTNPKPAKKRKIEHKTASMIDSTPSGGNTDRTVTLHPRGGALQKLPQEIKEMIHEYVLLDIVEEEGYSAGGRRDTMLLWAFTNAFGLLRDKKDYLVAEKFRVKFFWRHCQAKWAALEAEEAKEAANAQKTSLN